MIDLVRDGGWMERVAFRHIDPAREPLLNRSERFRPAEAGLLPIGQVLESGTALMIDEVESGWTGSDDVLERLRSVGGRSLIIVLLTEFLEYGRDQLFSGVGVRPSRYATMAG